MPPTSKQPNIVVLYADDLGFGDVGCYGASAIATPNLDRLAAEGVRFGQGYAAAATCTPSRYSLLTGSYPWRNPDAAILPGDAPLIIDDATPTLAEMLRRAGYATGVVGKWHLGLGTGRLDWNRPLPRTPNDVGFDYAHIMAATNDRVPCVYVENREVVGYDPADPIDVTYDWHKSFAGVPTGRDNPECLDMRFSHGHDGTIINGVSRIGLMRGGTAALWSDESMADHFAAKATDFVTQNQDRPFFLYYAFHQPHVPRIPGPRFQGKTALGPRGDVIAELDDCVGQLLQTLDRLGLRENTLVIFSSDNGPVLDDGYHDGAAELSEKHAHRPTGPLRGGKYSLYDGGTRVPFIVRWPGTVAPGTSDALLSQIDFYASFAALVGQPLAPHEAPDSHNMLDALLGKSPHGREELIVEGTQGKTVLRWQRWAFIPPHPGPAVNTNTDIELGNAAKRQLYDLSGDIGQMCDLANEHTDLADQLEARLRKLADSRATRV